MWAACGKAHTAVVTSAGDALAFGANRYGQLGTGPVAGRKAPRPEDDMQLSPVKCVPRVPRAWA